MAISDKLTYLNDTKGLIKDSINLGGGNLTTEPFRQYAITLKNIYKDFLANGIGTLWNNWEKVTGTGTSLSLSPTIQGEMEFTYKGNTSQTGTPTPSSPIPINVVSGDNTIDICGKNLVNISSLSAQSTYLYPCKVGETYTISFKGMATSTDKRVFLRSYNGAFSTSLDSYVDAKVVAVTGSMANYTMMLTSTIDGFLYLRLAAGPNSYTLEDIQLEKGSTATTYEPYIGHSYPIYLGVENLLNRSLCTENRFLIWTSGLLQSDTGSLVSDYIKVDINQNYAFNYVAQVLFYDSSKSYLGALATDGTSINKDSSIGFSTIKVPNNNEVVYMRLGFRTSYNDNLDMTQQSIIVNKGSMPSHVSTNPIELCKIGTYQDYIYKDNGSWYLHKEIGKLILGNANYIYNSSNKRFSNTFSDINLFVPTDTSRHDEYIKAYCFTNSTTDADGTIFQYQNQLIMHNYNYTDTTDFKNWLISINAYLYYVLATPTNTPITDTTLINQLEESKLSYISQTNISQVNNDLPFNLVVKALKNI